MPVRGVGSHSHLAAGFRHPERDLHRATLITIALAVTLYLGLVLAVLTTGGYGSSAVNSTAAHRASRARAGPRPNPCHGGRRHHHRRRDDQRLYRGHLPLAYAVDRDGAFPRRLGHLDSGTVPARAVIRVTTVAALAPAVARRSADRGETDLHPLVPRRRDLRDRKGRHRSTSQRHPSDSAHSPASSRCLSSPVLRRGGSHPGGRRACGSRLSRTLRAKTGAKALPARTRPRRHRRPLGDQS
jgi:hypothetical protein